jgi:uncharacterized membrane protein YgcG
MPWRHKGRYWRHIVTDHADARRAVSESDLKRLEQLIADGEHRHRGQVCLAIEPALPLARVYQRLAPRERALEVFGSMRVWDTDENCGVLVYLLLADRDVEIVADRGIHRVVGELAWQAICTNMEAAFRAGRFTDGLVDGLQAINALLAQHFPRSEAGPNELSDRPRIL